MNKLTSKQQNIPQIFLAKGKMQSSQAHKEIIQGGGDISLITVKRSLSYLLGISYFQPFEDGNKRTARLMANGLLMSHSLAPLSYRSIDEEEYRSAMLAFYEINSIIPIKKIFIEQYKFASENYAAK